MVPTCASCLAYNMVKPKKVNAKRGDHGQQGIFTIIHAICLLRSMCNWACVPSICECLCTIRPISLL